MDLDAGTITLRLLSVKRVERRVGLRVLVDTVDLAFDTLVGAGCKAISSAQRSSDREWIASVQDPDGHTL